MYPAAQRGTHMWPDTGRGLRLLGMLFGEGHMYTPHLGKGIRLPSMSLHPIHNPTK